MNQNDLNKHFITILKKILILSRNNLLKLLLISVSLIFVSCDNDSPTEVSPTEVSGLIDNVCGYDDFEYLAGCGSNQNGCGGLYLAEDIANTYCELEGYTSAISYDVG